MSFSAYPTYADSRVEWLGEVPGHWRVQSLKRVVEFQTGWTPPTGRDDLYGGKNQWVTIGDLEDRVIFNSAKQVTDEAVDIARISPSPKGSLLFSFKLSIGKVAFAGRDLFTNEAIATFLPGNELSLAFAYYALPVFVVQNAAENIYGAKLLNQELIRNALIAVPSANEQAAIAAFLDRETAKIDALVEEQRRLIALLREKRQAVISHATTKGLNPDAPMKDSGVAWLGEVPAHWMVTAAGRYLQILSGFAFPSEGFSADPEHTRLLRGVNVGVGRVRWDETVYWPRSPGDGLSGFELSEGELVIGMDRPWIAEGVRIAKLSAPDLPCLLLQRVAAIRPTDQLDVDYLQLLLSSPAFVDYFTPDMTGVSVPHLSPGQISAFPIPLPPPSEQRAIAAHVQLKAAQADQLIAAAEEATELLGERRSALISAAVTGKIDVRSPVNVVPFPVDRARARGLIAAEIIERSAHQATFGRVKLQKIVYLAEAHAGVSEVEGAYLREAAGPLDRDMIREMEREAGELTGVRIEQPGGAGSVVTYRLGDRRGAHRQDFAALLGDRVAKFDKLVEDIGTIETKGAEAVATLYAVWNDALIDGETPADMEIKLAVLSEWHPEKAEKFTINDLQIWLDWMRRHGIVPSGTGPKTTTGRLFA